MSYTDKIMQARIFMGSDCTGSHRCVSCGRENCASDPVRKAVKPSFVNFDELMIGEEEYLCESCQALLNDSDLRFHNAYYCQRGQKQIIDRSEILPLISYPVDRFVLSLPYSFKKHHWLFAGLSDTRRALIGTDTRTIVVDYQQYDIPALVLLVDKMIRASVPRGEIIAGHYSVSTRRKIPAIDDYEAQIAQHRPGGLLELIVRFTPAVTQKITLEGDVPMITQNEHTAAMVLYSVAARSQYRRENGIEFWGGYFERRINRLKNLSLHEFVSRLSDAVGAPQVFVGQFENIDNDEEIMGEIRDKTNFLVSLAFTMNNEEKQK